MIAQPTDASREDKVPAASAGRGLPVAADMALLAAVAGVMAALTWRGWADPLVDFGRESYVPWRLSQGARLHTDIAWFNGPLSQYWNALCFRLLGPGMTTLYLSNALVLGATVMVLRRLVAEMAGRGTALFAAVIFLVVFAFGQHVGIANYNWIAPYAHELTHGVALALGSVAALSTWRRRERHRWLFLGGLLLGLCFLTKVETFVAGAAGSTVLLAPLARTRGIRPVLLWCGALLAPILVSTMLVGVGPTTGAWPHVLAGEVGKLPFYRAGMGLDDPGLRLEETAVWAVMWALAFAVPVGAAWLARGTRTPLALPAAAVSTLAVLVVAGDAIPWIDSLRPLQLFVLVVLAWVGVARVQGRTPGGLPMDSPESVRAVDTALALGVLSLVLLGKVLLNVRSGHYGFALAAPGAALAVAALCRWLPDVLEQSGMRGDVMRGAIIALIAVFGFAHVRSTAQRMEGKTELVASGRDAFRADLRGAFVQLAVDHVREAGYSSMAVVPEGVTINYLARVPNPTPYINFMPPEEILFGDAAWEAAFRAAPPEVILMVPKDMADYGRGEFGSGYGRGLSAWIRAEYSEATALTMGGVNFEISVLVRRDGAG